MSARMLFILLFASSLLILCGFSAVALSLLWYTLGPVVPSTISIAGLSVPTFFSLSVGVILLLLLVLFLFSFFYLLFDRLTVRPITYLTSAMREFAKSGEHVALPSFPSATTEVRELADVFSAFSTNVEQMHARDTEVSRMKSDFISTAAHQLRTPMTGIRWALEALQKATPTEDQKALIDSAVGKSHDLVAIIGTLLDISAIESGKYKYVFEPTDMGTIVEEITRDFSALAQSRHVSLYYNKTEALLPKARVDKDRIKWVLNNLVENAIRYTPAEGSVQVSIESGIGRVFVRVRDTGIGIKEGDRSSIFERFYRAENAISKENGGNGLGLYIARTIATDHGGDLNFEPNKDSAGTTFILSLPIAN